MRREINLIAREVVGGWLLKHAYYVNAQFKGFSFIDPHLTMCRVSALNPGEFLSRTDVTHCVKGSDFFHSNEFFIFIHNEKTVNHDFSKNV